MNREVWWHVFYAGRFAVRAGDVPKNLSRPDLRIFLTCCGFMAQDIEKIHAIRLYSPGNTNNQHTQILTKRIGNGLKAEVSFALND